jgi:hypothetical protein
MAEYRNGEFAAAEQTLSLAQQTSEGDGYSPGFRRALQGTAGLLRAMSLLALQRKEEATNLFAQAHAQMPPLPADERVPLTGDVHTLIWWLHFKEARTLLGD